MAVMQHQYSLKELNTFGINATASLYSEPESEKALIEILEEYSADQMPKLVMGEGSNLLFKGDYKGLIIRPGMKGLEILEENDEEVLVRVGAAENWDNWVSLSISKGWFGLENLSLIPGSVGSAPVQNIGAYGVELKEYFERADAWDLEQKKQVQLNRLSCRFGYRSSIFKNEFRGRYIITHVVFRLRKQAQLHLNYGPVRDRFSENPVVDRTVYKCIRVDYPGVPNYPDAENQVKIPAAWLIEQAGWKGKRIGNVGTWPTQALVIVNYGNASGQEILDFSEQLRSDVDKQFGIYLEREVNVI
jgi:UDP-N-acetylmuramate dehydrogenase